jgi:hypothetical protein
MKRVGYAKLGRNMPLDPKNWGVVGGDDEPPLLLKTLALTYPDVEWVLVGRNSGEKPEDVGLPSNVTNPWTNLREVVSSKLRAARDTNEKIAVYDEYTLDLFRSVDGLVIWTGQHGTSNSPIPTVGAGWESVTKPQEAFINYASYVIRGINAFRQVDPVHREEVWVCPDPRNYVKCRDLKWPPRHPVLGQFVFDRTDKHERYSDTRTPEECGFADVVERVDDGHVWLARHRYIYSQLEICGILPEHVNAEFSDNFHERARFGLFINEARAYVKNNRRDAFVDYVLPLNPDFVHGKWGKESQEMITALGGPTIEPAPADVYYDKLRSVKCTLTTPSSGSGWATTKPWQAFATGTVCFFHPEYDTQGHIIPTLDQLEASEPMERNLAAWLRVENPEQLHKRVETIASSYETWLWLVRAQRVLYDKACQERRIIKLIAERLGI